MKKDRSAGRGGSRSRARDKELLGLVNRACVLMSASALRWGMRSAEIWAALAPALLQQAQAGADRSALVEELRARVRELAEIPAEEARALQLELDRLFDDTQPGGDPGAGSYRRRWKAKP